MVSDHDRRELFEALERRLGDRPAAILMELLPPVGWADVARSSELAAQGVAVRGEMAELRGEMAELRGELAELRAEIRAQLPKMITANIASMLGVAGLVLGAAKLA
ncbi:MAG: hypothetical protein JWO37_1562 [Acidimicrobiales bacterium]|jgi:hypothetical protein|nr:hypothetical protein [Acidimicrobiales bacterium]